MDGGQVDRPYHALSVIPDIEQQILFGLSQGKSLKAIADEYGVTDAAILKRVMDHPEYRDKQRVGIRLRMDKREHELAAADSNVSVTRADRLLNHARWLAERLDNETFGPKSHVVVENIGDLGDRLRRAEDRRRSREIDVSPISVSLPTQVIDSEQDGES
jgi:hypothetical protein